MNNAGVAPLSRRAFDAILSASREMLREGFTDFTLWDQKVERARGLAARLIGSSPEEVAFVKNTSQGLSFVANGLSWKPGDEVLIPDLEFPSNVYPWMNLKRLGVRVRKVRNRNGRYPLQAFEREMTPKTRLLSVSSVEFVNGFRVDLQGLGNICKRRKILFCVDAIQSLGLIPTDVRRLHIDFLSADGHKWLTGPEGQGIFYCRKGRLDDLNLVTVGWHTVVNDHDFSTIDFRIKPNAARFEEGSHNMLGIVALGAAIEYLLEIGIDRIEKRVIGLTDYLVAGLEKLGFRILSSREPAERSGSLLFTAKNREENGRIFKWLEANRVTASLRGPGIRVSPHFYNTEAELNRFFQILKTAGRQSRGPATGGSGAC